MKKKAPAIAVVFIAAALLAYFAGAGFRKDSSACILDSPISEDGGRKAQAPKRATPPAAATAAAGGI